MTCPKCGDYEGSLHYVAANGVEVVKDCDACCPITKPKPTDLKKDKGEHPNG